MTDNKWTKLPTTYKNYLKYFKSAPYQGDGILSSQKFMKNMIVHSHCILYTGYKMKLLIMNHIFLFHFIQLIVELKKKKKIMMKKQEIKDKIKHKIDTELKDIIKFIDHSAINNIKSCKPPTLPLITTGVEV